VDEPSRTGEISRTSRPGRSVESLLAWGGVVGPAVFIADWAVLGLTRPGYSPVGDAISRLAETGASTRAAMTSGFVAYGIGLVGYGLALRRAVPGPAWLFGVGTGLATFGLAAFPLGTPTSGAVHAAFAVIGYAGLVAVPAAVAATLAAEGHRHRGWARLSALASATAGAFLLGSIIGGPAHGLTQRAGLTIGDGWIILSALELLRRSRRGEAVRP
jgi:hypothetical membrane protein